MTIPSPIVAEGGDSGEAATVMVPSFTPLVAFINKVDEYRRSLKIPPLQLLQKSSKSASMTPQRPI